MANHDQMEKILQLLHQKKEMISGRMRSIQASKQKIAETIRKTVQALDDHDPEIVFTESGRKWLDHQAKILAHAQAELTEVLRGLDEIKSEMAKLLASEKSLESQIIESRKVEIVRLSEQQDSERQLLSVVQRMTKKVG
jgi:chaperonin cofactor prefoldin